VPAVYVLDGVLDGGAIIELVSCRLRREEDGHSGCERRLEVPHGPTADWLVDQS